MDKPGVIALKAITVMEDFAKARTNEVGGNNRGEQVEAFLRSVKASPGDPWCAAFVVHCLVKAAGFIDETLPKDFPISAYTPDFKNWAKSKDLWIPAANAIEKGATGDLVCFYFEAKGRIGHIGGVTGKTANNLLTVEGNTGPTKGKEVERDGDGVYEKQHTVYELGKFGGLIRLPF